MANHTSESASWQTWLLGIGAVLIGAGVIGLTSTLIGLRSDIEVVKNDLHYMKRQLEAAEEYRLRVGDKLDDHEQRLIRIESDNTRRYR